MPRAVASLPITSHDFTHLSVAQLQERLTQIWVRYEPAIKDEIAPLLFHLREKLKKQGSRTGEGFCNWVDNNLGLSRKTANRWADDYAISKELKKPAHGSGGGTSGQVTKSEPRFPDGKRTYQLSWVVSEEEYDQMEKAVRTLGGNEGIKRLILAQAAKKGPHNAQSQMHSLTAHA